MVEINLTKIKIIYSMNQSQKYNVSKFRLNNYQKKAIQYLWDDTILHYLSINISITGVNKIYLFILRYHSYALHSKLTTGVDNDDDDDLVYGNLICHCTKQVYQCQEDFIFPDISVLPYCLLIRNKQRQNKIIINNHCSLSSALLESISQ